MLDGGKRPGAGWLSPTSGRSAQQQLQLVLLAVACALLVLNLLVPRGGQLHGQHMLRLASHSSDSSSDAIEHVMLSVSNSSSGDAGRQAGGQEAAAAAAQPQRRQQRLRGTERLPVPEAWPFNCWEPKAGLSHPVLTIFSVAGGLAEHGEFMKRNRLHYAASQGYRYCELKAMDDTRIPAWTKLPAALALLPCSDFVYHLDADALFTNHTLSLEPWMAYMEREDLHLLLPADIIRESPLNFGVFFLRSGGPWLYTFLQRLYNRCACAWGVTHDWPAEQGLLYDLLVEEADGDAGIHTRIIPGKGWNEVLPGWEKASPTTVVGHIPHPPHPESDIKCTVAPASRPCKYKGVKYWWDRSLGDGSIVPYDLAHPELLLSPGPNTCRDVVFQRLAESKHTYHAVPDTTSSSILDLIVEPDGRLASVHVSEIPCIGYRDKKCDLKQAWDTKAGTGPIMPLKQVDLPPRTRGPVIIASELHKSQPHQRVLPSPAPAKAEGEQQQAGAKQKEAGARRRRS